MLLELGKFFALLLSILSLCALFHTVFFLPVDAESDRLIATLKIFSLAAVVCWAGGWLFREDDRRAGYHSTIAGTLPMKAFWWSTFAILILFVVSWYFEKYFLPLRAQPLW